MADMKAKHAFGNLVDVEKALQAGKINEFDILFLDGETEPKIGWIDAKGEFRLVQNETDFSELEAIIAKKADAEDVESLESQIAMKVDATEVDTKIGEAVTETVDVAKAYTDGKVEAAINEHMVKKYEITDVPEGTLIDYKENEIRIMCPKDSVFTKQTVGTGGDPNCYYCTLKTYVYDDNVVGYKEHLGNQIDAEILTDLKTDKYGRRYQPSWLALAKYDETTDTWSYYGANSTNEKYIGWDYQLDLFDDNGVMIGSDCIRISLSNEDCHYSAKPYYVGSMMAEVDTRIEEKIAEVNSAYEVIEF